MPINNEEEGKTKTSTLSNYLVAFIDLLGQSKRLLEIKHADEIVAESKFFSQWLKGTFGTVKQFREAFFDHVERLNKPRDGSPIPAQFTQANVKMIPASDSIILYVSLHDPVGSRYLSNMNGVYSIFSALGALAPLFIMMGKPFRAGIAIGLGAEIEGVGFYGSALPLASELEKKADYPRIIIDQYAIEYLEDIANTEFTNVFIGTSGPEQRLARAHAQECLSMIFTDSDGVPALDFLCEKIHALYVMSDPLSYNAFSGGYAAILDSIRDQSDPKIKNKYIRLKEYYDSRAASWLHFGAHP